ncbi:tryptophan halogenase family protein [Asticcacaulis machinosus]|uniref:Tryptophan 7-halogenase n=1 Tax=Asticcacaulis machinosus TaxID=2984211 RepID=A0ABT5HIT6_9CAUL|nr:tryptophan halogenase family protein [Asticcacaulis machinosus]MDC7676138.1 tryptophan 7-halogenase [Asticcacaulis machinosus]
MAKNVLIVGGGTAGWVTAGYLARMLSAASPDGARISLIESEDIGIIGVGEGTFPSIRKTLKRIGVDEADLVRECDATFKQGISFRGWRTGAGDSYFHPFEAAFSPGGLDLLSYWLAGAVGDRSWDEVSTVQTRVAELGLAPKLDTHEGYAAPLSYAYHFDAVKLARLLRRVGIANGVRHLTGTVTDVKLGEDGSVDYLISREHGELRADLYIDCTGFHAQLIGKALQSPYRSVRDSLFTNRALAMQVPYEREDAPIPSYTISTAQPAGWTWDIGLDGRRGIGYVYSTDHTSDDEAEAVLRRYIGPESDDLNPRKLEFEPGYRPVQWVKNVVAIGLSAGFVEPLEATGIGFAEGAALVLAAIFPWSGPVDGPAKQFNDIMSRRYAHVVDFIKMHYCLTQRKDTPFWRDNAAPDSIYDSLKDRLERWRYRMPDFVDVDLNHDIFTEANWQYVLYGMGFKTDLGDRKGALKYFEDAKVAFADVARQADVAARKLPAHRDLITSVRRHGFRRAA